MIIVVLDCEIEVWLHRSKPSIRRKHCGLRHTVQRACAFKCEFGTALNIAHAILNRINDSAVHIRRWRTSLASIRALQAWIRSVVAHSTSISGPHGRCVIWASCAESACQHSRSLCVHHHQHPGRHILHSRWHCHHNFSGRQKPVLMPSMSTYELVLPPWKPPKYCVYQ